MFGNIFPNGQLPMIDGGVVWTVENFDYLGTVLMTSFGLVAEV